MNDYPGKFLKVPRKKINWMGEDYENAPFELSIRPITVSEFRNFCRDSGYVSTQERAGRRDTYACNDSHTGIRPNVVEELPAVYVSWSDARAYCTWAKVRLPTEVEWFAARYEDECLEEGSTPKIVPFEFSLWEWTNTLTEDGNAVLRDAPTRFYYRNQPERFLERRKVVSVEATNISWCFSVVR